MLRRQQQQSYALTQPKSNYSLLRQIFPQNSYRIHQKVNKVRRDFSHFSTSPLHFFYFLRKFRRHSSVHTSRNFPRMNFFSSLFRRQTVLPQCFISSEEEKSRSAFHSIAIFVPSITEALPESRTFFPHKSELYCSSLSRENLFRDKSIFVVGAWAFFSTEPSPCPSWKCFSLRTHDWKQHPREAFSTGRRRSSSLWVCFACFLLLASAPQCRSEQERKVIAMLMLSKRIKFYGKHIKNSLIDVSKSRDGKARGKTQTLMI